MGNYHYSPSVCLAIDPRPGIWFVILFVSVYISAYTMPCSGESEYWFAMIKVVLIVLFIIVGLIYDWGGIKAHPGPVRVCHRNKYTNILTLTVLRVCLISKTIRLSSEVSPHLLRHLSMLFFLLGELSWSLWPPASLRSPTRPCHAPSKQHSSELSFSTSLLS